VGKSGGGLRRGRAEKHTSRGKNCEKKNRGLSQLGDVASKHGQERSLKKKNPLKNGPTPRENGKREQKLFYTGLSGGRERPVRNKQARTPL